jgi:phospholipid/cholesterol/gamma-HCH transport system permease protein
MSAMTLKAPERLDQGSGDELFKQLRAEKVAHGTVVTLDLAATESMDSLGGARLVEIAEYLRRRSAELRLEGQHGQVAEFIEIIRPGLLAPKPPAATANGFYERFTDQTVKVAEETAEFCGLCVDAIYWTIIAPIEGRGFRWNLFIDEIHEMGVRAIGIVALMNFLLGLIIAMLSCKQVEHFGMQIFVADLIMIGFARELAAVMTSVVVSARTGAAIAAELATMTVQEEIDALRGMGINVTQFLVAPKLLALVIVMPCLWTLGLISGILGGAAWGILVLRFQPAIWFTQTIKAGTFEDFLQGFLKVIVFAITIALIGCHNGLRVTGGSRGVGLMTTRAVVMDIFSMICIDIVFASVFYYLLK